MGGKTANNPFWARRVSLGPSRQGCPEGREQIGPARRARVSPQKFTAGRLGTPSWAGSDREVWSGHSVLA
ncbi:hypothetical protein Aph01nite_16730 [Acrocarpospora phusangensis]|uniref:Uncharacterized protein n=1 Tax=Acrocarpospora phusangensis TaxID=1070424 RepID=A0A919Q7F9_9ACTN|nr:hypothetical protein Aph01nite_16730 [Acrocarpospora phusangensis]